MSSDLASQYAGLQAQFISNFTDYETVLYTDINASISVALDLPPTPTEGVDVIAKFSDLSVEADLKPVVKQGDYSITCGGVITDTLCDQIISIWRGTSKAIRVHHDCRHQGCPKCGKKWAFAQGKKQAVYLRTFVERFGIHLFHATWSPVEKIEWNGLKWIASKARDCTGNVRRDFAIDQMEAFLKKWHKGKSLGWMCIYHPYRYQKIGAESVDEELNENDDSGVWVWGPHVHLITNFVYNPSEWGNMYADLRKAPAIFKVFQLKPREGVGEGLEDSVDDKGRDLLVSKISYDLNHAMFKPHKRSFTFGGSFNWKVNCVEWTKVRKVVVDENGDGFRRVNFYPVDQPTGWAGYALGDSLLNAKGEVSWYKVTEWLCKTSRRKIHKRIRCTVRSNKRELFGGSNECAAIRRSIHNDVFMSLLVHSVVLDATMAVVKHLC